jgi:ABC-type nitrate/sulfonate/bicarbonate transport system ATPase subunit
MAPVVDFDRQSARRALICSLATKIFLTQREPPKMLVRLSGRRVQGPPPDVVYLFQQYTKSLFPWRTVAGNVAFALR